MHRSTEDLLATIDIAKQTRRFEELRDFQRQVVKACSLAPFELGALPAEVRAQVVADTAEAKADLAHTEAYLALLAASAVRGESEMLQ